MYCISRLKSSLVLSSLYHRIVQQKSLVADIFLCEVSTKSNAVQHSVKQSFSGSQNGVNRNYMGHKKNIGLSIGLRVHSKLLIFFS
jgi:hypothetical protein